jgi:hypothetical protein
VKHNILFEDLRVAFPPQPIRGADAFTQRGRTYCDTHEYEREMDGKTWEQLDPQFFARRIDGLSFLGDDHIVAVLPHYLHLLIVFKPTSPVPETLLPLLTRPEPTDRHTSTTLYEWLNQRFEAVTERLSDRQCEMVAATLQEFVASAPSDAEPAQRALERYWYRFLPGVGSAPSRLDLLKPNPLLPRLRAAFPPRAITGVDAFESSCPDDDGYRHAIDGKAWDEIDPLVMAQQCGALGFLDNHHALAVLPMYLHLLIVLDMPQFAEGLLAKLTKPLKGDPLFIINEERFAPFADLMSDTQKAIVAATLVAYVEKHPHAEGAKSALGRYWHAFA